MSQPVELLPPNYSETMWSHNGLRLCTYNWGRYSSMRPTIIFLHGWLDHGDSWNTVARHLANYPGKFNCMAFDHRGHGHSDHLPLYDEYHFADYVSDLQAFIEAHVREEFILIGHSMGGTIASIYTALCPQKPKQCILIEGLGPKHESESEATHRLKLHLSQRKQEPKHRSMLLKTAIKKLRRAHPFLSEASLHQQAVRLTQGPNNLDEHVDTEPRQWRWDPRHRNKSAISFSLPRFLDILSHIEVPTHCIFGKESWYLQLPDLPSRLKAIPSLQRQIYLPSGHSPHVECPELLARAIYECLGVPYRNRFPKPFTE